MSADELRHLYVETSRTLGESVTNEVETSLTLVETSTNGWSFLNTLVEMNANEWRHLFACLEVNPKTCGCISTLGNVLFARVEASHANEWGHLNALGESIIT
ncbi:hypothetical protein V6N12_023897 [Hibiscus sabdariffa]|uniref:Uncharacterized protein n=1 Tax=Hibiscus sabdariffa TaxID=183260 RepID=A0ABR2FZ70_9ROSI